MLKKIAVPVAFLLLLASGDPAGAAPRAKLRGWMKSLPQILYLIDVCVGQSPDRSAVVTKAWFVSDSEAAVRMKYDDGKRVECVVDRASRAVLHLDRLPKGDRAPGEFRPSFIRRGQKTVEEQRRGLIRVEDNEGERLGWAYQPGKN